VLKTYQKRSPASQAIQYKPDGSNIALVEITLSSKGHRSMTRLQPLSATDARTIIVFLDGITTKVEINPGDWLIFDEGFDVKVLTDEKFKRIYYPEADQPVKDNVVADTVNALVKVSLKYCGTEQLREQLQNAILPVVHTKFNFEGDKTPRHPIHPKFYPINDENVADRMTSMMWEVIDTLGMFPKTTLDQRLWDTLNIYNPRRNDDYKQTTKT
jgi:hypothetical protein